MAHVNLIRAAPDHARIVPFVAPAGAGKISTRYRWRDVQVYPRGWTIRLRGARPCLRQTTDCKALLEDDLPFAIAIGVCVASSLVLPPGANDSGDDSDKDAFGGADDIRSAAMGIISFIPFFNWLAWVFAWLDTRRTRYLVYAIVYAAPYLKNDFSLSPDESWLPLVSLAACIVHVQLDTNSAGIDLAESDVPSVTEKVSEPSVVDRLSIKPFLRKLEKLLQFNQISGKKAGNVRSAEEKSQEERLAEQEIHEWQKSELQEWDKKLGNLQGDEKNGEQKKNND